MSKVRLYRVGVIDGLRLQKSVLVTYYAVMATSRNAAVTAVARERPVNPRDSVFVGELDGQTAPMPVVQLRPEQLAALERTNQMIPGSKLVGDFGRR